MFIWRHAVLYIIPTVCIRKNDAKTPPSALVAPMPQLRLQMVLRKNVEQSLFEDTRYDGQHNNYASCPFRGVPSGWKKETFVEWSCFFWSYPLWDILANLNAFNNNRLFQKVSLLNTYQEYWIQTFRLYLPRVAPITAVSFESNVADY